jgi:pimeloyl-ACP methyl ester carboxylesterase
MAGEGRPLLLFHGWGLSGRPYRPALRALAERGFRAIAPSLAILEGPWTLNALGEAAYEIAVAIEATRPALIGHSFGGAVAVRLAFDQPDIVDALVLVDSVGVSPGFRGLAKLALPGPHWRVGFHPPTAVALIGSAVREGGMGNLAGAARWVLTHSLEAELRSIRRQGIPSAVMWAERDSILPLPLGEKLAELLGCPLHVVAAEDGWPLDRPPDHDWPFRAPDVFARRIEEALAATSP